MNAHSLRVERLGENAVPSSAQSIAAYDALAAEYDDVQHRTTRELEGLSAAALRRAELAKVLPRRPKVLELGCGTGALSVELAAVLSEAQLLISDPAPAMLGKAISRLSGTPLGQTQTFLGSATEALAEMAAESRPPDAILAGLADPYISEALLSGMVQIAGRQTAVFLTVPSLTWARAERSGRLHVPIEVTRFRTAAGGAVYSRSRAYDPPQLRELFEASGIDVLAAGLEQSREADWQAPPAVAWALGRPRLADASRS